MVTAKTTLYAARAGLPHALWLVFEPHAIHQMQNPLMHQWRANTTGNKLTLWHKLTHGMLQLP